MRGNRSLFLNLAQQIKPHSHTALCGSSRSVTICLIFNFSPSVLLCARLWAPTRIYESPDQRGTSRRQWITFILSCSHLEEQCKQLTGHLSPRFVFPSPTGPFADSCRVLGNTWINWFGWNANFWRPSYNFEGFSRVKFSNYNQINWPAYQSEQTLFTWNYVAHSFSIRQLLFLSYYVFICCSKWGF